MTWFALVDLEPCGDIFFICVKSLDAFFGDRTNRTNSFI